MIAMPPITETPEGNDPKSESAYGNVWYWWRNLSYMLREQMALGMLIFLVIFVVDLVMYKHATRVYQSQASFVVDQSPFQFAVNQNDVEGSRLLLQSIISSIISFDMRDITAQRLHVSPKNVCILGLGPPALSLKHPDEVNISVTTERGSRVADIESLSSNPQFAADATNAILDEILGLNRLVGRLNDVNQQIVAAQAEVNQYAQNVSAADATRAELEQDVLGIERHLKAGGSLESAPAFVQDQGLLDLQKKRIDADAAYSAQTQISIQGQELPALAGAKRSVDMQIQSYLNNKVIGERSAAEDSKARVVSLKADLKQQVDNLNQLEGQKTELLKAVGDFKLRRQLGLFNTGANSSEASVIVVFDRARPAWKATSPNLLVYIAVGVGLSVIFCLGLMFLRHNTDRAIKYPQQVEISCGVPCLAVLPEAARGKKGSVRQYVPEEDTVSGLFYLRNQLLRGSLMGHENRIVSFTDLGKSVPSGDWVAQLGWLLATAGKPTLLVDLDFKNPSLGKILNIPDGPGLSEWVASDQPLNTFIQKSDGAELGLLQPGKELRDVDLRLSRRPLAPELEKLQAAWPYILIYAPSLLNQPHLLLAAPGDTPLISLVQYGKATLEDLDEVIARSESCHFRFAGVVLHHFPTKRLRNRRNIFGLGPHRYVFDERLKPARV